MQRDEAAFSWRVSDSLFQLCPLSRPLATRTKIRFTTFQVTGGLRVIWVVSLGASWLKLYQESEESMMQQLICSRENSTSIRKLKST